MTTNKFLTLLSSGIEALVTAISASTGAPDANKIVATGSNGKLDPTLMPTGIGAATSAVSASESLTAGNLVNIWDDAGTRKARRADASNGRPAHGFVLESAAANATATVYQQGELTGLSGLTPGAPQFLSASTPGGVTATAPSTAGQIVQEIGVAYSATSVLFEYNSYIEIV